MQEPSPLPFILLASNWVDFWYGLHVHSWLSTSLARMSVWHLMDLRFWCAVIRRDPSIQDVVFFVDVCLIEVTSFLQANVQAWLASWRDVLEVLDNYVGTHGLCSEHCELRLFCELMEGPSSKLINHHVRVAWTNPHHLCCVQLVKCCRNKQTRSQTSQSKNVQRCSGCLTPQRSWNHYSSIKNS